ncbi:MAG TPA: DUF1343 domain-containing protein [Bacteroidales bacterium]|nr:MAG: hypothetical protein A2X11_07395 [Bacteroidetes bacterium GWE2_42_24]OFY29553.1 MAG: hypothetical protein A2X09_04205 [Bacteroidetes bacterium GWF2_43_11]PKP26207.1 MAG: DUF1343 domain-containing protein [Bacteroidetes bacterium HGW-Bacteroidetes-22]HAQ64718.1 DUF1343 domain-containing protein [Bacteroidales bacterium]HBZ67314.1 DUF1343 domain-containing protein [Bacteroidales bacterium]
MKSLSIIVLWILGLTSCSSQNQNHQVNVLPNVSKTSVTAQIVTGAEHTADYTGLLANKRVGLVVNQTSVIGKQHLIDTLLKLGIRIEAIFAPEHGFRGNNPDGDIIRDNRDLKTGIEVWSLYGKTKKPTPEQLDRVDIIVYDIQDVGVRFYTFISTLHYVMEACAEAGKPLIVFDRPNPNSGYIDGPVLDTSFRSFVGMHPIPVVYGLTPGELAEMINGEGWLRNSRKCNLKIIPLSGYSHGDKISLLIPPSPNLPNDLAINLYPSLCWFEATPVSIGRGTPWPFQVIGFPDETCGQFCFEPQPIKNASISPPQKGKKCFGDDLRNTFYRNQIDLDIFIQYYHHLKNKTKFFERPDFFDKLAGTDQLRFDIESEKTEAEIRDGWQKQLTEYKTLRQRYLLYPDHSK